MGIEINELDKRAHPKIAVEYLETYRRVNLIHVNKEVVNGATTKVFKMVENRRLEWDID